MKLQYEIFRNWTKEGRLNSLCGFIEDEKPNIIAIIETGGFLGLSGEITLIHRID